jgi:hypothetical protein
MGELALNLGTRCSLFRSSGRGNLFSATLGDGELVFLVVDPEPGTQTRALESQCIRGAALGELRNPTTFRRPAKFHGDAVRTGDGVEFEVDSEADLR